MNKKMLIAALITFPVLAAAILGLTKKLSSPESIEKLHSIATEGRLQNGEVYKKEFVPGYTDVQMIPMFHGSGGFMVIPFTYVYDDDYIIYIKANDGSGKTAMYHVRKDLYDAITIGSEFQWDSSSCSDEASYKRTRAEP